LRGTHLPLSQEISDRRQVGVEVATSTMIRTASTRTTIVTRQVWKKKPQKDYTLHIHSPMKMEQTQGSETSAIEHHTVGNKPKDYM
jgi:hypothetical protein